MRGEFDRRFLIFCRAGFFFLLDKGLKKGLAHFATFGKSLISLGEWRFFLGVLPRMPTQPTSYTDSAYL